VKPSLGVSLAPAQTTLRLLPSPFGNSVLIRVGVHHQDLAPRQR
jgi:hypothetical protein